MRSRINWLKWGDKNTKYFHATTIQRRQRNRITMLKNSSNELVRDSNQLKQMTVSFFQNLYSSCGSRNFEPVLETYPCLVEEEINQSLMADLSLEEVKMAVHQLGSTKALWPDGLNGQFFQRHWEDVQLNMFKKIQNFFTYGYLDPELNRTHITLITEVPNPKKLEQFRPINLCNFANKIISKVIMNKLKPLLVILISSLQIIGDPFKTTFTLSMKLFMQSKTNK